jgi:hypothetical protein
MSCGPGNYYFGSGTAKSSTSATEREESTRAREQDRILPRLRDVLPGKILACSMMIIADMCRGELFVESGDRIYGPRRMASPQQSSHNAQPRPWLPPTGEASPCNRQEDYVYRASSEIASLHDGHGASTSSLTQSSCTSTEETINQPAYCFLAPSIPGGSLVPNCSSDGIPASIGEGNLKLPEGLQNASDDARKKFECPICSKRNGCPSHHDVMDLPM